MPDKSFSKSTDHAAQYPRGAARRKLNDFYWKLEGEDKWFSWREVCEYRRGVRWAATTDRILVSAYHSSQLTQRAADWGKREPHLGNPCIFCGADGRSDGFCPNR